MSDFTETLTKIEAIKNTHECVDVSNFYVSNHLRENDCCVPSEDWEMILCYDFDPWCLIGDVTEYWTPELKRKVAKTWWDEFKKINTDDYGHITEPFMFWSEGTDQFDIMEAFKDFFDIDVIEDKDFMGMVGFANGDYLVNAFKRKQEENKMKEETTMYFANGDKAIVHRYGINDYSIYFEDVDSSVRGTFLDVVNEIKAKEKHIETKAINNRDLTPDMVFDEENHPMTSYGNCMNLWTTGGDYDVFIIMHEAESQDNFERIINCNVEDTCHTIMQNNNLSVKEKKEIIKTIVDAYTDYGIQVIIKERR